MLSEIANFAWNTTEFVILDKKSSNSSTFSSKARAFDEKVDELLKNIRGFNKNIVL